MAPAPIQVRRFDDYVAALERAKVVLDPDRRKDIILAEAQNLAFASGLELVEDEALLEEVAGLVEWPVVLMGAFDAAFLAIPAEVIRATIRANQKCFVLRSSFPSPLRGGAGVGVAGPDAEVSGQARAADAARTPSTAGSMPRPPSSPQGGGEGALSNRFILVANLEATDGGTAIVAGNERVVRARLSDAKFFCETDRKIRLEDAAREAEEHRLPREARHAIRARRAHRGAGAGSSRRSSAPIRTRPSARRGSPRPTSSPRWSASSPSCRG